MASWLGIIESSFYFVLYEYVKFQVAQKRYIYIYCAMLLVFRFEQNNDPTMDFAHFQRLHAFTSVDYIIMSAGCKLVAAATTYPHETLKTRIRELENGKAKYKGLVDCVVRMAKEEGIRSYYNGMLVHLMRVIPSTAIIFLTYEKLVKWLDKL